MQARSILMNWKQLRRTENNAARSTVPYVEAHTNFDKGCHVSVPIVAENGHAEELGFRDFSSLFLVKENRRQLGNSACAFFAKVSLTSRVFAWTNEGKVGCNAKSESDFLCPFSTSDRVETRSLRGIVFIWSNKYSRDSPRNSTRRDFEEIQRFINTLFGESSESVGRQQTLA
jgi:hypothetical protein